MMTNTKEKPPFTNRVKLLIGGIISLLLVLFLIGGIPRYLNTRKVDKLAAEDAAVKVNVKQATQNTKPNELILPSSAQAWHFTPIWARVNGYLVRYLVDIGDQVKAGQLLAEIDTPENDEQLAEAEADLVNAMAQRDIAKITSDRWQQLWNKNQEAVSKQEVDQYTANLEAAEATVVMNEKNVARLTYLQQFKFVYAPFNGIITQRLVDIGTLIYGSVNGASQELFQMAQTDTIRFFVEVPQTYYRQIQDGIEAEVSVLQFPGKIFTGKVTRFANALDPTARTMTTQVDVENNEGLLYAGIYANVKFLMPPPANNFIIPTTAMIIRSGLPQIAIVGPDNVVTLRDIKIGRDYGSSLEIIDGLHENDNYIVLPTDRIRNGVKVQVAEPT